MLKRDDIGSKKCECTFKLLKYCMTDETLKFNVISIIHNHVLDDKLTDHPIVCCLVFEERGLVSNMTLDMVAPKNILKNLFRT